MVLTTVLSMMRYVSEIDDRDFVDRLHSFFTTNLLIGLSVLVSFKQFGGKPIECLTPDIFSSSWEEYAENYCWAQDTYFVAPSTNVESLEKMERKQRRISYYQWVPFFLLIEAAFFRLPSILWRYMSGHSGIKIAEIVKMSSDPNNIKPEIRKVNLRALTVHLQGALRFHKRLHRHQIRPHSILRMLNLPYSTSFVTSMYLLTKFAYLSNVFAQLLLMNSFLETDRYQLYGFGAVVDLLNGTNWEQSGIFPRVSLCDFQVRVMGNLQEYTIQCVLIINIFNEKIFVLLWFWYLCLLLLTVGSFLYWLFVFVFPWPNRRFISQHLEMCEIPFDPDASKKDVRRFIDDYLRHDGLFVIRMLTLHTGVIFGTELVQSLWISFVGGECIELKRSNSYPEGEFPTNDHHLENALNNLRKRRRHSHLKSPSRRPSNVGLPPPSITFGDKFANEKLIPPPAPSPSLKRLVKNLDKSQTNSPASSREMSPKKVSVPNWQQLQAPFMDEIKEKVDLPNHYEGEVKQNNEDSTKQLTVNEPIFIAPISDQSIEKGFYDEEMANYLQ
ncbi:hypothetical protein niasHT_032316 [Heterodera trifolii]|uniref:Innexin n=1 Tax=Heterodera trifolii TaxID=157864 RepID=A0ABD2HZM9_9BILA